MLGAIIGDVIGSPYEFNNVKHKNFDLWTPHSKLTDDSICTLAVADIILHDKPIEQTLQSWCRQHPVGYSKTFQAWVNSDTPSPYESWSDGAVMRISPVGFLYTDLNAALHKAIAITQVTHNHLIALQGVEAYLTAMFLIKDKKETTQIKEAIQSKFPYDMTRSVDDIRKTYDKFYVRCSKTVPEAIICALDATSFEDAVRNAVSLGGDSDTLACMAGALAELRFGIPDEIRQKAYGYLDNHMKSVLNELYHRQTFFVKGDKHIAPPAHGHLHHKLKAIFAKTTGQECHNLSEIAEDGLPRVIGHHRHIGLQKERQNG